MTTSSPIVLAAGQITRADRLTIELVKPPDMPAAVLIKWPPARSVVEPNPKALASVAASLSGSWARPRRHSRRWVLDHER